MDGMHLHSVGPNDLAAHVDVSRALVVEVPDGDDSFASRASAMAAEAAAHGLAVALVYHHKESWLPEMNQAEVMRYFEAVRQVRESVPRVQAWYANWMALVRWARDHDAGPGANRDLRLSGPVPAEHEAELLLRRAFHDLSSATLEMLAGGKSGASVFLLSPGDGERRARPFVVKIHSREKMERERSNCVLVRDAVGPRWHAPLYPERCVEGHERGLVVYDVVDRATPFRTALPDNPVVLVGSLFDQTLGGFRLRRQVVTRSLVKEFERERLKVLRWESPALREAGASAKAARQALPEVEELAVRLRAIPAVSFMAATVHGDLHAGNLFVAANSSDVLMIDYGSVLHEAPAVADPACLEVSLAFPPGHLPPGATEAVPPGQWRQAAYKYPLSAAEVPELPGPLAWLPRAIRSIRNDALLLDSGRAAYPVAVACYLLRFASFDDAAPADVRGLAYALACDLVAGVEIQLAADGSAPRPGSDWRTA